ncbi:unnamed protein product, partial [Sphagnum jensenii]
MVNSMMDKCTSTIEKILHQRILESKEVLNKNQCEHLLTEFKRTLDIIQENLSNLTTCNEIVELLTHDLHQVVIKVNDMVEACCSQKWWVEAIFQLHNEDAFMDILQDLKLCIDAMSTIVVDNNIHHIDGESFNLKPISQDEIGQSSRSIPHELVGIEKIVLDLQERLQIQPTIGIVGMGGIGKTTMAKALYDHIYHNFEAYCFMPNIKANKDNFQLLIDILQDLGYAEKITNIVKGEKVLRHFFCTKKVLIILDDVRCQKQLDDILPVDLDFTNGSRIIMTSRSWIDLRNNVKEEGKFDMPYLDNNNAMELFEKYVANNQSERKEEFGLITSQIVKACGGLPLSLKVLGSYLKKETNLKIWQQALRKLQQAHSLDGRQNDEQLWGILRISFDELAEEEQSIFLDIVCFFCTNNNHSNMMTKATALRIWDDEKCSPELTLSTLVNMSLVHIASDGLFVVHDQLRDMGRMISKTEYKGSRWNVEAKKLTPQFLKVVKLHATSWKKLPKAVKQLKNLEELYLQENENLTELPHSLGQLTNLKTINVSNCDLDCLPEGMGQLKNLSMLILDSNERLVKLPECIEKMKSLTRLDVRGCDLNCVPQRMGGLEKLSSLNLSYNKRLVKLPECIEEMKSLTRLDVGGCDLDCVPQGMGRLENLSSLNLSYNKRLVKLPECIEEMKSLTRLDVEKLYRLILKDNKRLVKLPEFMEAMKSLTLLDVGGCDWDYVLRGMGQLDKLSDLNLRKNKRLVKAPECIEEMMSLTKLDVGGCDLDCVTQGMGQLEKLSNLHLSNNKRLMKLREGIEEMKSLTWLDVGGCDLVCVPQGMGRLEKLNDIIEDHARGHIIDGEHWKYVPQ